MQNITVSVDETVHRRARLRAAELNTSLSALVKGFLEELAGDTSETERRRGPWGHCGAAAGSGGPARTIET